MNAVNTRFIESDAAEIVAFAHAVAGSASDDIGRAMLLYEAVRDGIAYDPYDTLDDPASVSARRALTRKRGYCIPKAGLLAAGARALGIPSRLGFADVRNHLASRRLLEANGSDVFRWHAYTELYLAGKWVKATPAFDAELCARAGIEPLHFDGRNDSVFHAYDRQNRKHMEYVLDRGRFADVPFELVVATWRQHSPKLFSAFTGTTAGSFKDEI
ncbi:transglutaminase-like domain-containing protein [Aromatoleum aromaticum]|uniref:transglutaminase-like domain-containing protein n=1 Tax=Aromatoleum aromaticum TaxID=551760 RepID=UPI001459F6A4|nr:transglutaminase-like domain-containing protein [Aromatoleum aromaticum]NMG55514.1 transglutaminase [Aromatoleum aromaticum]